MGYHSEVRAIIYGPPEKITALIVWHQLEHGNSMLEGWMSDGLSRYKIALSRWVAGATDPVTGKVSGGIEEYEAEALDLYGAHWKWYSDYPDVKLWHELMNQAEANFDLEYEFHRVGEEDTDIERLCSADNQGLLGFSRSITDDIAKIEDSEIPVNAL